MACSSVGGVSTDAVEVVESACEAMLRRDFDAWVSHFAPDAVWYGTKGGLDQELVVRGHEGFSAYMNEIVGTWDEITVEVEDYRPAGDAVVVFWTETARTAQSAVQLRTEIGMVYRVRDGKIYEGRGYLDRGEALAAAGIT